MTEMVTTEGPAFAATAVVVVTSSLLLTVMVCGVEVTVLVRAVVGADGHGGDAGSGRPTEDRSDGEGSDDEADGSLGFGRGGGRTGAVPYGSAGAVAPGSG